MRCGSLKTRMIAGDRLVGTFLKTPAMDLVEILSASGLDFVVLDAEHAGFGRSELDRCLAMARALDFPALVRVPMGTPENILVSLDAGAVGLVVPHVDSMEKAKTVAQAARFGEGGRGYAGSTRWAGFTTRPMPEILKQSEDETLVLVQIEERSGVEECEAIAGVDGIDGLFIGPADLSVAYGHDNVNSQDLKDAMTRVGQAAKAAGKAYATWVPDAAKAKEIDAFGFTIYVVASEQSWVLQGAKLTISSIK